MIMDLRHIRTNSIALIMIAVACVTASAAPPTFQITQLFSNLDGSMQFVQLTETAGLNGQQHFAGLTLTSTHNGIGKQYTFSHDLPTDQTAHMSIVVAATLAYGKLPVQGGGFSYWCCYLPDFADMPARFLATDGGSINFAGADQVTYASLPTDGRNGLYRDGTVRATALRASPPNCQQLPVCVAGTYAMFPEAVNAIEYYNPDRDHYFYSASAPDIDALDSGQFPGWQRTEMSFAVTAGPSGWYGLNAAVCRFYIPPAEGDSHFLSASADECAQVRDRFPEFVLETDAAFYVSLPDPTTGQCPADPTIDGLNFQLPVFRLWNQRADTNHRYTTNIALRNLMVQRGYVSEGYGPNSVAFCVQASIVL
jgi:hypothetical protein